MAKLIRCILTVGGNFKMPRDNEELESLAPWNEAVKSEIQRRADS